jgi:hypothetical protein
MLFAVELLLLFLFGVLCSLLLLHPASSPAFIANGTRTGNTGIDRSFRSNKSIKVIMVSVSAGTCCRIDAAVAWASEQRSSASSMDSMHLLQLITRSKCCCLLRFVGSIEVAPVRGQDASSWAVNSSDRGIQAEL